ncbi:hypothetical protein CC80DRAFT_588254 [Byssothecium circinans]|uniref:Uncharacterized protein n=1 Tax=Byssothecium circinans TaxID=147558 RepID=A0A6A5UCS4_9PLEO|nr:hypothetical protein CC80DRAFT_588254 [Byssothecium circinans]
MSNRCPALFKAAQICWYSRSKQAACYCPVLTNTSCPGLCRDGQDSAKYLLWARDNCGNISGFFSPKWVDYTSLQTTAYKTLFAWPWHVSFNPDETLNRRNDSRKRKCPSKSEKLGVFALLNVITLVGTAWIFRRTNIEKVTRGYCGAPGSRLWVVSALASAGLSIGANFLNAALVHRTRGFHDVPIVQLAFLWCSRPRIAWVAGLLVLVEREKSMYFAIGASSLISEFVLQAFGSYYLIRTVVFAFRQGYYYQGQLYAVVPGGRDATMMYIGAFLWLASISFVLVDFVWAFLGLQRLVLYFVDKVRRPVRAVPAAVERRTTRHLLQRMSEWWPTAERFNQLFSGVGIQGSVQRRIGNTDTDTTTPASDRSYTTDRLALAAPPDPDAWKAMLHRMGLSVKSAKQMRRVIAWMIFPFLGQWLFWGGFVGLAGDLYCPPRMGEAATVWISSAVVSVILTSSL